MLNFYDETKMALRLRKENLTSIELYIRMILLLVPVLLQSLLVYYGVMACLSYVYVKEYKIFYYIFLYLLVLLFAILQYTKAYKIMLNKGE